MSHYADAEQLLALADAAAVRSHAAMSASPDDPMSAVPHLMGAVVNILAAQVHATLAVADATAIRGDVNDLRV